MFFLVLSVSSFQCGPLFSFQNHWQKIIYPQCIYQCQPNNRRFFILLENFLCTCTGQGSNSMPRICLVKFKFAWNFPSDFKFDWIWVLPSTYTYSWTISNIYVCTYILLKYLNGHVFILFSFRIIFLVEISLC
jgi:hypothetical protein